MIKIMKNYGKTIILLIIAMFVLIPYIDVHATETDNGKVERESLESIQKMSVEEMVQAFKDLEEKKDIYGDIAITYATEMIKRHQEFSLQYTLKVLENDNNYPLLGTVLVDVFNANHYDSSILKQLVAENSLADLVKYAIVARTDFSEEDLSYFYALNDDDIIIALMKVALTKYPHMAKEWACELLSRNNMSNEKIIAASIGITDYCINIRESDSKKYEEIIEYMIELYNSNQDEIVQNNIIFTLSQLEDFALFSRIIKSDHVDFYQKVTAVEYNVNTMLNVLETNPSAQNLEVIVEAMTISPWKVIGNKIQDDIKQGIINSNDEIERILDLIDKEGLDLEGGLS